MSKGQVLIGALLAAGVVLILTGGLLSLGRFANLASRRGLEKTQALSLADAGLEKALRSLQLNPSYPGEGPTPLGPGTFTVSVSSTIGPTRTVTATGTVGPTTQTVRAQLRISSQEVQFFFGVQVGEGGLTIENNATIAGNVYSNGPVRGSINSAISGAVTSAGATGLVDGFKNIGIAGDVRANTITKNTIAGNVYCTTQSQNTISGQIFCPSPDPQPQPLPITQATIDTWKNQAAAGGNCDASVPLGGQLTVDINQSRSLGPCKHTGTLRVNNGGTLVLTGLVWVTGNVFFDQGSLVRLDSAFGPNSSTFLSDGRLDIQNGANLQGSGDPASYLMALSTRASQDKDDPAIFVGNQSTSAIVYSSAGVVRLKNTAQLKEVTGYAIYIDQNAQVTYESGLASVDFTSGPGGGWYYVIGSWQRLNP